MFIGRSPHLCCLAIFLTFLPTSAAHAQTSSAPLEPGAPSSNALPFLMALFSRYAHATSYHLEYVEEHQIDGEFSRNWSKVFITSIVGPANHYRFERRGQFGEGIQVSDGETEWTYYAPLNQYTQQPTPGTGPSHILSAAAIGIGMLRQSQSHTKNFMHLGDLVRTATFGAEQTIEVSGLSIPCIVIATEGKMPDTQGHVTTRFTFWIDKQTKLIRKSTDRREGELVPNEPHAHYLSSTDRLYQVAELDVSSFSEGTFTFAPPPSAVLVRQFEDEQSQELAKLVGKPAPSLTLKAPGGKEVTLQSFPGKPVLLDFWATWCAPCRESLPALEKLYQENKKGLVLLSLDEDDDDPKKATDFWAMRKEPWPNFHTGKEIREKFPLHGIPYFVLLDSSGNVTFSQAGLDENSLRAAVAALASSPLPNP
jgi:thiol-disulfide isomerase/thioredoxin/outer membrane lipoprotein-sorting protein